LFIDDPLINKWETILSATNNFQNYCHTYLVPKPEFILMDHNKLHQRFESWAGTVKSIYDHHQDDKCHLDANPRIIRSIGSNVSLIVEWWRSQLKNRQEKVLESIQPELASLMLAPILVDTVNLKGEYGRVTDCDRDMVDYLISQINSLPATSPSFKFAGNNEYFAAIDAAKQNVSNMSSEQLLRKDFKIWTIPKSNLRLGMSTIVNWSYADWQTRSADYPTNSCENLFLAMKSYVKTLQLDVLVVLGSKQYGTGDDYRFERELFIHVPDVNLFKYLHIGLTTEKALGLKPIDELKYLSEGYAFWFQSVASASRKVSYPIFKDLLVSFSSQADNL